MLAEGKEEVKQKNSFQPTTTQSNATVKLAMTAVMSALIAVTTMTAIPMPPPLSTLNFAPIIIFVVGILMGPVPALVSSSIGSALGFLAGASIGSIIVPPGFMGIFLLGIVVSRGPMGATVGLLRKVNEAAAMVIAVLVETAIFFFLDWSLFGFEVALITLGTLVDLVFVPIGYGVVKVVKRMWDVSLLE
jgi:uncharacterized membrane protein